MCNLTHHLPTFKKLAPKMKSLPTPGLNDSITHTIRNNLTFESKKVQE